MLLLIGLRFMHFGPSIDDPHSWRQADTANYIWAFYKNGIDLFHPSVCWMGGHKTTILEFPLPEAIVATLYKVFGPHLVLARIVFLLFFLGGARYLFLLLREIVDIQLARLTVLVFMTLPLALFYSRAIHIDFSAVFFAHGMAYYFLKGIQRSSLIDMLLGSLFATLGLLIKVPYLFYLVLPLLAWTMRHNKWRFLLRNSALLLFPVLVFVLWRMHVGAVNAAVPDWSFIPGYHPMTDRAGWYFGVWEMREYLPNWLHLHGRFRYNVVGDIGYWFCLLGMLVHWKRFGHNFMRLWALGSCLYVVIFFNLNVIHDYYQIPLLVPAAFFIAVLLWHVLRIERKLLPWSFPAVTLILVGLFAWNNVRLTEGIDLDPAGELYFKKYFTESEVPIEAGKVIQAHTRDALTIISYEGLDCRSPHVLYRARRNGWSIPRVDLKPDLILKLQGLGAKYLVMIRNNKPDETLLEYLEAYPLQELRFGSGEWPIRIYDLR